MMKIRESLVDFIQNQPKLSLLLSLIVTLLILPGTFFLKSDFSYRAWYSEDDPLLLYYDKFEQNFGNDDSIIIAIESEETLYTPRKLKIIHDITEKIWKIPGIIRVDSLSNYDLISANGEELDIRSLLNEDNIAGLNQKTADKIYNQVKDKKLVQNYLISENKKMTIIRGVVKPSLKKRVDNKELILQGRALTNTYKKLHPDLTFYFAGTATFIHIFTEITERDVGILMPLLFTLFIIILWLIYRRKSGIFIPLMCLFSSVILMLGVSGYLGHSITTISSAAPSILLTVAIADAIHLLTVYFFGLKQGYTNYQAVRYSLIKNFYPTLLTSITTAIGFLSFSNSLIKSIAELGVEVGIGVIFAWLSSYFI